MTLITNQTIQGIAHCTDINDHNEAVLLLAKALCDKVGIAAMKHIKAVHEKVGHMTEDACNLRSLILKELLSNSEQLLSKDDFKLLHNAF